MAVAMPFLPLAGRVLQFFELNICCRSGPSLLPAGRVLQFVSWKSFAPVGPELPEPVWVRYAVF